LSGRIRAVRAKQKRNDARVPAGYTASMKLVNPLSANWTNIQILDMSRGGMKLSVPEALEPGTVVQIRSRNTLTFAKVRYCVEAGAEFHVGVQLQNVF
jgi:hypothetical protein